MWRHVKEKRNFIEFDLRNVSAKKHKHKRFVLRLEALYLVKNVFCLYFSPIPKLWSRKKVIFKVFIFWRYSKTLMRRYVLLSSAWFTITWRFMKNKLQKSTLNKRRPKIIHLIYFAASCIHFLCLFVYLWFFK